MIGFVVGAVCLVGLIKVIRSGRGGFHRRGFGGPWSRRLRGPRAMLRRVFERLDTSPAQEKVLVAAATELWDARQPLREEAEATRREVARALRGPAIDEVSLGELFARHDEVLRDLRKTTVGALARVHDALDEQQRASLADSVERGFLGRGRHAHRGPYRDGIAI
jgi:uncharacterized membrane protein